MNATQFIFSSYKLEFPKVTFTYKVEFDDGTHESYEEVLELPKLGHITPKFSTKTLEPFLQSLHLALGMSYWKQYCPPSIKLQAGYTLTHQQATFWNTLYTKGLGEFFYRNNIDYRNLVQFPVNEVGLKPVSIATTNRLLVPVGGGKDSIVTIELLRNRQETFDTFALNPHPLMREIVEIAEKRLIEVKRTLDSKIFDGSSSSAKTTPYNGHVPVTSIYIFTALLVSAIYGYSAVAISAEHSANYGNVEYLGQEINHQWSKSEEFERLLQKYLEQNVSPNIRVYSLLRDLREFDIVEKFVQYPQYFHQFSSCNRNFALQGSKNLAGKLWCGECPKCAFVFVLLGAFLPKATIVQIFGKNLFADEHLISLYRELLGLEAFKPFECVGTPEEMREAFAMIKKKSEFQDD
ncbi:MAG: hypothetical protein AAB612_02375, partial [Patescibacteria group bacterium]